MAKDAKRNQAECQYLLFNGHGIHGRTRKNKYITKLVSCSSVDSVAIMSRLYPFKSVLVTPVFPGNVIGQFHLLDIHVPQDTVHGTDNGAHDLVDKVRVFIQQALETGAVQA